MTGDDLRPAVPASYPVPAVPMDADDVRRLAEHLVRVYAENHTAADEAEADGYPRAAGMLRAQATAIVGVMAWLNGYLASRDAR